MPSGRAPNPKSPAIASKTVNPWALAATGFLALSLAATGCKRESSRPRSPAEIHGITRELAEAASEAAPGETVIKTRRARGGSAEGRSDEIYVGLRGDVPFERVEQRIGGVASKHGLTVDPEKRNGSTVEFALRSRGSVTHRIEIERLARVEAAKARLAILLDDLGSDPGAAEALFALHVPLTISVLPYHAHSEEIARAARQHGCEVMLHLPMQSVANEASEEQELKPGLSPEQVRTLVEKMLDAIPEADGVNNHQGSEATADRALMNELMRVLKDEGVFYVDSRTTAETVAYEAARQAGVRAGFRNVPFLDDLEDARAVGRQLQIAIRGAREKGEAIAIGHPHSGTLEALRQMLPEAKKEGVQLVLVSELVR